MCNYISLCPASCCGVDGAQPPFSSTSRARVQGWDTFGTGVDTSPPVQYHFACEEDANYAGDLGASLNQMAAGFGCICIVVQQYCFICCSPLLAKTDP